MLTEPTTSELLDTVDRLLSAAAGNGVALHMDDQAPALHQYFDDAIHLTEARQPDEPLFCYSEAALAHRHQEFQDGFPGLVTYAVKANPSADVIELLADRGMTAFDVASPVEMSLVHDVCPSATLHYNNPIKSRAEIACAYDEYGVRHFSVDDAVEISKIGDIVENPGEVELAIRFRAGQNRAVCDFSTKFGAKPKKAAELLSKARKKGFRTALTFHPGSQLLDPLGYVEHIEAAAEICRKSGVRIDRLNVGGGFPVEYDDEGVPPLQEFFAAISDATKRTFGKKAPKLVAEPGRALVSHCTSLLTRVKHRRSKKPELFINDGIYGALMELNQLPVNLPCRVIRDGAIVEGEPQEFVVYGPTCDPLDRLPRRVSLPATVAEGDWIEFGKVGAYGSATVTRFNGYGEIESVTVRSVHGA